MDVCLYHADKCHFDIVTRDIEKAKIIPRNYVKRLAMCVCSCRKNKFKITDEVRQLDLQEMANYLGNCIKSEKWPVSLVTMLKPLLLDDIFQKKKMARLQRKIYQDSNIDEPDESLLYKEEMTDLYKRRCEANRIGNKTKTPGASLKDGHCMNCLDKFVTLKHPDVCKYHPGFIDLEGNWNCCGMKSQFNQPTLKEHQITGCSKGVHNWRHGKPLKQTKIKNYVFDWSAQLETW
ncbi:uncharacterized protein LOC143079668 isoform X3 [Mytilus galloprovincialis]|uniref:uncharacterized protein LOC143079668 isoform X3 n=1 Tax=Mytilus galloprovincialis TaxID=29158 RepID=UPI003F7CAFEB